MSAFLFQILVVKSTLKRSLVLKLLLQEKTLSDNGCAAIPCGTREKNAQLVRSGGYAVGQGVGWIEEVSLTPHSLLNIENTAGRVWVQASVPQPVLCWSPLSESSNLGFAILLLLTLAKYPHPLMLCILIYKITAYIYYWVFITCQTCSESIPWKLVHLNPHSRPMELEPRLSPLLGNVGDTERFPKSHSWLISRAELWTQRVWLLEGCYNLPSWVVSG